MFGGYVIPQLGVFRREEAAREGRKGGGGGGEGKRGGVVRW